eukprot:MONOS_9561.1-p1 / transcript=MONOS_9561.1 / gene=MONOS_9561 / organism=Monocercomonoides_exilis_PA203 / gene_product=unspecified product / transcript_product=unspecified product / location=Mono_scaffold00399:36337-37387(+) / protein_length=330 / sequence_SO=supercontig / SO=protein_coding / is_pseudo=false
MKEMTIDENEKKKDEKHLADLCECYALLNDKEFPEELIPICLPCLLKVASKKERNKETQKEVEMALLALGNIGFWEMRRELYLNEIKEIIKYHQEHHNLTHLAYGCAWKFLYNRYFNDRSLEDVIVNELHFARESRRELEELTKSVDWKRKDEEKGEREAKEALAFWRWFYVIDFYFNFCELWSVEWEGFISSIVQVFRASRGNHKDIHDKCFDILRYAADIRNVKIDDLLKSGAIGAVVEEIQQPTINDDLIKNCYYFFLNFSERLKEKDDGETDETKRKELKRKIFEKMEEEGYEDVMASFHKVFEILYRKIYPRISFDVSDNFVNV